MAESPIENWKNLPCKHIPTYENPQLAESVLRRLHKFVPVAEIKELKANLEKVAAGEAFFFVAGDCAESFAEINETAIRRKLNAFHCLSKRITDIASLPVVFAGRMAGQFFKPRSAEYEPASIGHQIPSYKGDGVNGFAIADRAHQPLRLLKANSLSMQVAKLVRALSGQSAHAIANRYYFAHEGLHLPYETALTEQHGEEFYNRAAHFLWMGDRTRQIGGGHVDYFGRISNPIGVKIGPSHSPGEIAALCHTLNPRNERGKLVLTTRLSAGKVEALLPPLVRKIEEEQLNVLWQVDPMHANTRTVKGRKVREVETILEEVEASAEVHKAEGTVLSGLHLEMTGEVVEECFGRAELAEKRAFDEQSYTSLCDPRLGPRQGLEVAERFALIKKRNGKGFNGAK